MELWFLGAAAALLSIAIVYASVVESKRVDKVEKDFTAFRSEYDLYTKSGGRAERLMSGVSSECMSALSAKHKEQAEFNAHVGKTLEASKKEYEVMHVRQRSLEKRIIEANRTVNLIFGKPIPVQMEQIPHTINKEKKGRGRSALIHDS